MHTEPTRRRLSILSPPVWTSQSCFRMDSIPGLVLQYSSLQPSCIFGLSEQIAQSPIDPYQGSGKKFWFFLSSNATEEEEEVGI